jgi:hypothetical protein
MNSPLLAVLPLPQAVNTGPSTAAAPTPACRCSHDELLDVIQLDNGKARVLAFEYVGDAGVDRDTS